VKCGGPFGGNAIIRKNLDDVQWEFTCSLTGVRISFAEAMRERGLCRACTDRICRGCGDAPVEPPDTKCDWCREPDALTALLDEPDEDESQNDDEDDGYACPSCGAFDGYVRANIDSLNYPIPAAGPERFPGYCEVCDWRDKCPKCGQSEGFLPELICVPDDVYLAAHCTACGWHDVEGEKVVEQKRDIWAPRHAQWIAEQSAKIAETTRGVTPPSCRVCQKPMEFRFGLNEVNNFYLCADYRDEAHRAYVGKDRNIDGDKWIAEQRAKQELTAVDLSQPASMAASPLLPREPESWASMEVVAGHLGVAIDAVYRWIDVRHLPAHRIGLVWKCKLSEVDAWVRNGGAADDSKDSED
jgi:excisionase family DNA binding protein